MLLKDHFLCHVFVMRSSRVRLALILIAAILQCGGYILHRWSNSDLSVTHRFWLIPVIVGTLLVFIVLLWWLVVYVTREPKISRESQSKPIVTTVRT